VTVHSLLGLALPAAAAAAATLPESSRLLGAAASAAPAAAGSHVDDFLMNPRHLPARNIPGASFSVLASQMNFWPSPLSAPHGCSTADLRGGIVRQSPVSTCLTKSVGGPSIFQRRSAAGHGSDWSGGIPTPSPSPAMGLTPPSQIFTPSGEAGGEMTVLRRCCVVVLYSQ
jgi:hypothetical protein